LAADGLASVIIVAVGAWLIVSPLATTLGFVSLPPLYWLYLAIIAAGLCDSDSGRERLGLFAGLENDGGGEENAVIGQ